LTRPPRWLRRAAPWLVLALAVALGGCQPTRQTPTGSAASSTPSAAVPGASGSAIAGAVTVDQSMLEILPSAVGGAALEPADEAAATIALDPALAGDVEAVAVGLAVSAGASATQDLVIANVVRLRPDVFDEGFFRGWRDSYDAAACEPAGGVLGNAEAEIDGRKVFIGSCANGGFTYHTRYGEDVVVSLTSVGERRFGELVMNDLGQ
jgi:hypothetical protein